MFVDIYDTDQKYDLIVADPLRNRVRVAKSQSVRTQAASLWITMYARTERNGFDCWGNEVAGYKGE